MRTILSAAFASALIGASGAGPEEAVAGSKLARIVNEAINAKLNIHQRISGQLATDGDASEVQAKTANAGVEGKKNITSNEDDDGVEQ
jgi:hypothetical protein